MNTTLSRSLLVYQEHPIEGVLSKQLFFKVGRLVYAQNISKTPVKKFTFIKVAGRPVILLQMNSFTGIFQGLWH